MSRLFDKFLKNQPEKSKNDILKNKDGIISILEDFEKIELSALNNTSPDFYIVPRNGTFKAEISHWGYRKLAKKEGIIVSCSHITQNMIDYKYFVGYDEREKLISFDKSKWQPEFSAKEQSLKNIVYFVVYLENKNGNIKDYIFDKNWIDQAFKPKSGGFKWDDDGYDGIAMREKSIVRYILKRQVMIPSIVQEYEENYDEYHYGDFLETIEKIESLDELRAVYKDVNNKDLIKNKAISDFMKIKAEKLKIGEAKNDKKL